LHAELLFEKVVTVYFIEVGGENNIDYFYTLD
jgi:hypothetical protein